MMTLQVFFCSSRCSLEHSYHKVPHLCGSFLTSFHRLLCLICMGCTVPCCSTVQLPLCLVVSPNSEDDGNLRVSPIKTTSGEVIGVLDRLLRYLPLSSGTRLWHPGSIVSDPLFWRRSRQNGTTLLVTDRETLSVSSRIHRQVVSLLVYCRSRSMIVSDQV